MKYPILPHIWAVSEDYTENAVKISFDDLKRNHPAYKQHIIDVVTAKKTFDILIQCNSVEFQELKNFVFDSIFCQSKIS